MAITHDRLPGLHALGAVRSRNFLQGLFGGVAAEARRTAWLVFVRIRDVCEYPLLF
jgi:hypothetical protein